MAIQAGKRAMRVVSDASEPDNGPEVTPTGARLTVSDAAQTGDHLALLVAMRDRIARAVSDPTCPPRDLAALTRRLQDIAKEIEAIDLRAKEEAADDAASGDEAWDAEAI